MGVLSNLEPASVFYYFEEICGIPHTSHHEKALSDYCVQFAKAHGLACRQDEMGNVLIKAPATPGYEKEPGLILQGHLDMVGDKTADCPLDLEKDAIHPVVDGGYVCAEGTTLGGDDGIAVAYALAVLDAKDIPHPALEVVLTVCEEVGLLGASAMDFSDLEGRILVNIDSEEEGVLTAGCAGGRRVECHLPITRAAVTGTAVKADVTGLVGGHSGTEIHKGRANAIALLGRWLTLLTENGVDYAAAGTVRRRKGECHSQRKQHHAGAARRHHRGRAHCCRSVRRTGAGRIRHGRPRHLPAAHGTGLRRVQRIGCRFHPAPAQGPAADAMGRAGHEHGCAGPCGDLAESGRCRDGRAAKPFCAFPSAARCPRRRSC